MKGRKRGLAKTSGTYDTAGSPWREIHGKVVTESIPPCAKCQQYPCNHPRLHPVDQRKCATQTARVNAFLSLFTHNILIGFATCSIYLIGMQPVILSKSTYALVM